MSISALSTNLLTDLSQQHRQNPFQQIQQDFSQLASALQSGDLADAQSAYSGIQKVLQGNQSASNSTAGSSGSSTIQNDFTALGQALQSGDLTQAQGAFSQLQNDFQSARQSRSSATPPPPAQDQFVSTTQSPARQVQQDYSQLASALQSGNLTDAQSAFAALQQALQTQAGPNAASSTNSTGSSDPIANDFNALGQALSSGNLTQAQSAFAQLQNDVQSARQNAASQSQGLAKALLDSTKGHHHHHHGGGGSGSASSASTTTSTSSSTTSGSVNVYA